MLLWSAPQLEVDPVLGDSHETSSGAVLGKWLLDNLNLERSKSEQPCWCITRWLRPTCTHLTQPYSTKCSNSTIEKQWHHSPVSHCHVSVTLEWIQTILGYRQRQQCRLSAEFLLLLSQHSLLSNLEAHLTHHLSSFITPLLLTTVLCSTRIFEFPPEGGFSPALSLYDDNSLLPYHGGSFLTSGTCRSHSS